MAIVPSTYAKLAPRLRSGGAVLAVLAGLVLRTGSSAASDAPPVEIHDRDDFSMTVPAAARPCFLLPASRVDAQACPGLKPMADPSTKDVRVFAVAFVGGSPPLGQLTASAAAGHYGQPTEETAREYGKGMVEGFLQSMPPGSTTSLREPLTTAIVRVGNLSIARFSFVIDKGSKEAPSAMRAVGYGAWASDTFYGFLLTGNDSGSTELAALADQMGQSIRLRDPAPPGAQCSPYAVGYLFGQILVYGGIMTVVAVFIGRARRNAKRRTLAAAAAPLDPRWMHEGPVTGHDPTRSGAPPPPKP
jgi:hypothetical protein